MKALLVVLATPVLPLFASAQTYPSRPITLVVPYTPGTGIDIIARTVGPKISERWRQPGQKRGQNKFPENGNGVLHDGRATGVHFIDATTNRFEKENNLTVSACAAAPRFL